MEIDRRHLGIARASLDRLSRAMSDLWQTMDAIGAYVVSSTQRRFQTQLSPDGVTWKPSQRAIRDQGLTLLDHGHLRSSLTWLAGRDQVEVGTSKIYAAIHQFGGTIHAKNVPLLRFKIGDHWISKPSVFMPARPFLGIDERDQREIDAIVKADLEAAIEGKAT
jgi:phage virion morphogenesis protein